MRAYFITFRTYGTWLHGDARGSMDPRNNIVGTPLIPSHPGLLKRDKEFSGEPVALNEVRRGVVFATVEHVCGFKGWQIRAVDVRSNHVHLVLSGDEAPELIMNAVKSWSTRIMVAAGVLPPKVKAWSRHGSTIWLNTQREFDGAVKYVRDEQGPPLARALPARFEIERLIRVSAKCVGQAEAPAD